ncbi:MAG: respiratory chain complex I subunit 1 family protein [Acidobacteriota bacterium]
MRVLTFARQFGEVVLAIAIAPLFAGWIAQCRAWLQNRSAPPLTQTYRMLRKLFHKDAALAVDASPLFRTAPYVLFGTMVLAAAIIPSLATDLPFARAADAIALIGLFATARVFMSLAAMDIGTSFGTLGARREMMIGFLAEPALLMVLFNAFLLYGSTALPSLVDGYASHPSVIDPSVIFAAVAFVMVLLAENARIPIDNPATHLELTMIHEAMLLEYSARHLALIEWASSLKLFNYACIGFALFLPWGIAIHGADGASALLIAVMALIVKLALAGAALALIESVSAKLRIFRAPEFLAMAFLLAVLGLLVHLLLGVSTHA